MAIQANCRPVDIHRDFPLPEQVTLQALILRRPPGPDGMLYSSADVISESDSGSVAIRFRRDRHRLMSETPVSIPLRDGRWRSAYLLLLDEEGGPFAQGAILTPAGAPVSGSLDAAKNLLQIHGERRG